MGLHKLKKPAGSTRDRKRVARGASCGQGGQGGRGHKGQMSRSGSKKRAWSEGGQMPLVRRIPKRGFANPNKTEFQLVKIAGLAKKFTEPGEVNPDALKAAGLIKSTSKPIKVLSGGELQVGLTVYAHAFSKSAEEMISKAGGKVERI